MLTKKQQRMLVTLLYRDVSMKKHNPYNSRAFYRAVGYLEKNNLVKKVPMENKSYSLELTLKGRFLSRILAGFTDEDKTIREKFGAF